MGPVWDSKSNFHYHGTRVGLKIELSLSWDSCGTQNQTIIIMRLVWDSKSNSHYHGTHMGLKIKLSISWDSKSMEKDGFVDYMDRG